MSDPNINWINKSLQINEGSYGILSINAHVNCNDKEPLLKWLRGYNHFDLTTFSYINAGGEHEHHNFTLTTKNGIKFANVLYEYATKKKSYKEDEELLCLEQKYKIRGKLFLSFNSESGLLDLNLADVWYYGGGLVSLNKKQAKQLSGYIYFWMGQYLIGQKTIKIRQNIKVLDIQKDD